MKFQKLLIGGAAVWLGTRLLNAKKVAENLIVKFRIYQFDYKKTTIIIAADAINGTSANSKLDSITGEVIYMNRNVGTFEKLDSTIIPAKSKIEILIPVKIDVVTWAAVVLFNTKKLEKKITLKVQYNVAGIIAKEELTIDVKL